jgi:hypothetical protein
MTNRDFGNVRPFNQHYQAAQEGLLEDKYERVKGKLLAEEVL